MPRISYRPKHARRISYLRYRHPAQKGGISPGGKIVPAQPSVSAGVEETETSGGASISTNIPHFGSPGLVVVMAVPLLLLATWSTFTMPLWDALWNANAPKQPLQFRMIVGGILAIIVLSVISDISDSAGDVVVLILVAMWLVFLINNANNVQSFFGFFAPQGTQSTQDASGQVPKTRGPS